MAVPGRLKLAAEMVPLGSRAADIGCDHGWLALALCGRCKRVIAADISEESLKKAARRAPDRNGVPRFETRLGDGLSVLAPGEADCLVITGLSGATIAEILEKGPDVVAGVDTLVLQPVQGQETLRLYLSARGWRIEEERLSRDARHTHVLMRAVPGEEALSELQAYAGPRLLEVCPPLFPELMKRRLGGLRRAREHGDATRQGLEEAITHYLKEQAYGD